MRKPAVGMVLCLIIAGCGTGSDKHSVATTATAATVPRLPATFSSGYEQAWGHMKQVGAEVVAAINQVKRAQAHHQTVPDAQVASEFAVFASHFEPALLELQRLTPPASVTGPYHSMATAAVGMGGSLRNFSSDANAHRVAQGRRDLASYLAYAVIIDKAATKIFNRLGLR